MLADLQRRAKNKGLTWVGGEGPKGAKLVIVGEAPGKEEDVKGKPFVGAAGHMLDNIFSITSINRSEVYITNVVKVKPPDNKLERLGELGFSLTEFTKGLHEELDSLHPNCVMALGDSALSALCNLRGITKWRGSILRSAFNRELKVIPSLHPAWIVRGQFTMKPLLVLDMKRAKQESKTPEINLPKRILHIAPSLVEVRETLNYIKEKAEYVSFDIETDHIYQISCIALASTPTWSLCIPFRHGYRSYWSQGEEFTIWRWLREMFQEDKKFIAQNALFDCGRLVPKLGFIPIYIDTMWAHQTMYAELPKGLDLLASIYTREPYYKDDRKVWKDATLSEQLWKYNDTDAAVTLEVALRELEELEAMKLTGFFFNSVMPLYPVLLFMQSMGIKINEGERSRIRSKLVERAGELSLGFEGLNPKSPKQMQELLYGKLHLPKQYHRKRGGVTTDKESLQKLYTQYRMPVLKDIIEYRHVESVRSNFLDVPVDGDGRLRTSFGLVETGRLSSSGDETGAGTHLQNVPDEVRPMFVADKGCSLIEVDKVQGEVMLVAWFADDDSMKGLFKRGEDIHVKMAELLFGGASNRNMAKKIVHAIDYRIGPKTMSGITGLPVKACEEVRRKYFAMFPGIPRWQREVEEELRRTRMLVNPFGRKRLFFNYMGEKLFSEGIAFLPQSTLVDDTNRSLTESFMLYGRWIQPLHQMHDGVIFQVSDTRVEEAVKKLRNLFQQSIIIKGDILTVPVKIKVGKSWGTLAVTA